MKNTFLESFSVKRSDFVEILIVGILIGVSVSALGSIVFDKFKDNTAMLFIAILLTLAFCVWLLSKKLFESRRAVFLSSGFFIYMKESNEVKEIPRYRFSKNLARHLKAAFCENEAIKRQWDEEPLSNIFSRDSEKKSGASAKLIREAVDYYLIETLSTHLTDYFNEEHYDKSELTEFSREDIPSILLRNRLLQMFSSPMEDRDAFSRESSPPKGGTIVMAMGKGGALYSRFDLVLPRGARVTREDNKIVINTSNFILKIETIFDGAVYDTPRNFKRYYLGMESMRDYRELKVAVKAEVEFKLLAALRKSKWDYHAWLDGFLSKVEKEMSGELFFDRIQWEAVATMIQCGNAMPNKPMQPTAEAAAD